MQDVNFFPYNFRKSQKEIFDFLQSNIENGNILISAPTGFGKTVLILSSVLPYALKNFKKIIWAVKTGPETDRPIEELKVINRLMRIKGKEDILLGISIRGKKDMCLLKRDLKEDMDYDEVSFFCKKKIKNHECVYYDRLDNAYVPYQLEPLVYSEVLKLGEKYKVCPYYYQLSQIHDSLVISVNYNYIFNEQISWALRNKIDFNDVILVIDEAHNLQFLSSSINYKEITLGTIKNCIKEINDYNIDDPEVKDFLNYFEIFLLRLKEKLKEEKKEDKLLSIEEIYEACKQPLNSKIEDKILEYGIKVRSKKILNKEAPRSSLYRLGEFLSSALEVRGLEGVSLIATIKDKENISLEIFDMRAKEFFSKFWNKFHRVILCSGTLKPVKSFAEIIGIENFFYKNVELNVPKENCITIIPSYLSTKGEELKKEECIKYIEAIKTFVSNLHENIAIFSASYRIQESLINHGLLEELNKLGRKIFIEYQDISGDEAKKIVEDFKKSAYNGKGILIASASGRFAEGVDFPGKELVGVFLVGIPFDRITEKTKALVRYYIKQYGRKKGIFYSYILPALRRASHSLGRAIRSPEDKAIFILGDKRYKKYLKYLPKFISLNVYYVNSNDKIANITKRFKI